MDYSKNKACRKIKLIDAYFLTRLQITNSFSLLHNAYMRIIFIFLLFASTNAFASIYATPYGSGSIHVDWSGSYGGVTLAEYKNGVYQRTINVSGIVSDYTVTGRTDAIWKYVVYGEPTGGGGGGCDPVCPLAALWEKINKNPLFFLASSAHAAQYIGTAEAEMLRMPGVPGAISLATTDTDGSYSISWGAATGPLDRYELQERKDGGSWSRIHNSSSRSKGVSGKATGIYDYRVRACNDSAYSSNVNCYNYTSIKTITVIRTPGSISVPSSSTNGSVSVSWAAVSGAASYKLQEQKNSGSWADVYNGTGTSKTVTGRGTGTYKYRVAAVENGKVGSYRTSSSVIVSRAPAVPGTFTVPATSNDGSYTVSWSAVSGAENYNLIESGSSSGNWTQTATSKSFTKGSDGSYTYKVRACNVYSGVTSCSGWTASKTVSVSLPKITGPTSSNTGSYQLTYASTTGPDAELRIYKGGVLIGDPAVSTTGGTFSVGGADTGTWDYKLYSGDECLQYDAQGNCTEPGIMAFQGQHTVQVDIPATGAITLPSDDKDGGYSISWGAATGTPSRYELQESKDGGAWSNDIHGAATTTNTVSGRTTGEYSYRVRACFSGCSVYSAVKSITVVLTPSSITTPASSTNGNVDISWATVSGADSYILQEQKDGGAWSDAYGGPEINKALSGRGTGTYKYRVAAIENGIPGDYKTSGDVVVSRAPAKPTGFTVPASSANGVYSVSWDTTTGADSYKLEESGTSSGNWTQSANSKEFTKTEDGSYTYRVQACSTYSGVTSCSTWTSQATAVVDLPNFFVQTVDGGNVYLVWEDWAVDKVTLRRDSETIYDSDWNYSGGVRTFTDTLSVSGSYSYTLLGWECLDEGAGGSCVQNPLGTRGPDIANVVIKPSDPVLTVDTGSATNTSYNGSLTITSDSTGPIEQVQWQMRSAGDIWPSQSELSSTVNFTLSDLADGNYEFRSKNCNSEGCSDNWSSTVAVEIWKIDPPSQPVISAIPNSVNGIISIEWQDLTSEFAHLYEIYENGATAPTYTLTSTSGDKKAPNTLHNYVPAELSDGDYNYTVVACNPAGCSDPSELLSFIVAHRPADLSAPTHADTSNGAVYVQWDAAPGDNVYYELQQREVDGTWSDTGLGAIQYSETVVRGLSQGDWQFSVRACNKYTWSCSGYSPASSAVGVVPTPDWANADYVPADDAPNAADTFVAHDRTVGMLSAAGGVSGGQASYQIEIDIPPGRNNIQPNVNLNYSSQTGNSVLGMGWSISAVSAISRCGKTLAHDGVIKTVQYSASEDRLCLDGQRLILVSGIYGNSGAVYRPELDDFTRITQFGGINSVDAYFTAELKSGRIRYYGNSPVSRHIPLGVTAPISWAISREEDRTTSANSVTYQYQFYGSGEYVLSDIYYTGKGIVLGDRRINFLYEPRPDVSSRYLAGGLTRQTRRLAKITTYVGSSKVLEYRTVYKLSGASDRSLLDSLQKCGYESSTINCHTATSFTWEDTAQTFELRQVGYIDQSDKLVYKLQDMRKIEDVSPKGDADGNGVVDWPTWQHDAEGRFVSTKSDDLHTCKYNFITHSRYCATGDFNQDGATDSWRSEGGILQIAYTPNSWISTGIPMVSGSFEFIFSIADYNRDGRPDIIIERGNSSSGEIYLYLHTGDDAAPFIDNAKNIYTYQTDGENRTTSVQFMGDMDGNGLPDFMEFNNDLPINNGSNLSRQPVPQRLFLTQSESTSSVTFTQSGLSPYPDMDDGFFYFHYFIDVNGDGLQDWITAESTDRLLISLNKGAGQFSAWSEIANSKNLIESRPFPYYHSSSSEWRIATYAKFAASFRQFDIDADGRAEVLMPSTRLVSSCEEMKSFEGGSTLQTITVCGDELYTRLLDYSSDGGWQKHAINVDDLDDSVYQYDAIKFIENSDGTFRAELSSTEIVGSATQTAVFDGFGNGLQDLTFTYGCRTTGCSISGGSGVMSGLDFGVYINRNRGSATGSERYEPTDMLAAVENGFGLRDEWHYRPLSSRDRDGDGQIDGKPFYERGGYLDSLSQAVKSDHFEFTSSMYVVAEHRQSNGVGSLNTKQYRYKGAVFNNKGRGFQGFHTIIEEDLAANIETQSDFHQIFPLAGKLYKQRRWELGDRGSDSENIDAFEESSFKWQFWPKGGHTSPMVVVELTDSWSVSANDPYFVGPQEQSTVHRTLSKNGSARTELHTKSQTSSFDQWGNVLLAENRYEEGGSHVVRSAKETQYVAADEINWWLNKPLTQTVTNYAIQNRTGVAIAAGTDVEQSVVVDYLAWDDNARKPTQVKTKPSTGKWTEVDTVYNSDGLPTKVTTTAEGEAESRFVETTALSSDGYFPKTVKNALGHSVTTITNARFGKPDSVTDANGLTTHYEYDAFGRAIIATAPSVAGLKTAPDVHTALQWCSPSCSGAPGAIYKTIRQQAGTPTQVSYHDSLGRVIQTEVQAFDGVDWVVTKTEYNALGQVTFESVPHYASSPNSYGTRYLDYDTLGRALHKTVDQTNSQILDVRYTHEQGVGFTTTDILVNGRAMSRTYNGLQQLIETKDALQGTTKYAYDGAGNPIVLQDAAFNSITAKYNALGQKEWVDDPNMGKKSFTYTGFGEVETEKDGNLDDISYIYDRLGRLQTRSVNAVEESSWGYDGAANGIGLPSSESRSNASYSRSYTYDPLSRPDLVTTTIDGEDFVTVNHYDRNYGRLKGLSYPSGLTLQYSYNDSGYQSRTSNAASGYTYREITQMDAWGEWKSANVAASNYTVGREFYAETGQMEGGVFDSLVQNHQSLSYEYDDFGNLRYKTVGVPSESPTINMETYVYDPLNRLDYSSRTDGPAIDYDYDAIGNLLKKDDFATSYDYTGGTSGGPSAVKSVTLVGGGTTTYGYDQNGNRTHENGEEQVRYNAFNKPTLIRRNGTDLYFSYGADQMRYKQINQATGKTTIYIDKLYERISGGGETKYRHFIGDIAVVTTTDSGADLSHEIGFTHRDRLGSTVAVGDHQGNLLETHSFDPFGKPRQGNILDKAVARLESSFTTRGFTDHEHLDDVELIHMNGRAYDYNLGRFLSVDPFIQAPGNSQSMNPYSYIMNNPLSGVDPSGYCAGTDSLEDCANSIDAGQTTDITNADGDVIGTAGKDQNGTLYMTTATGNNGASVIQGAMNGPSNSLSGIQGAADIGSQASRENIGGMDQNSAVGGLYENALSACEQSGCPGPFEKYLRSSVGLDAKYPQDTITLPVDNDFPGMSVRISPSTGQVFWEDSNGRVSQADLESLTDEAVKNGAIAAVLSVLGVRAAPVPSRQTHSPDFIVTPNGTAFPVPRGATGPTPVVNQAGNQTGVAFTGGNGGANGQVSTMRIMNPTPPRGRSPGYSNGYIKYENSASPKPQGVDPNSGNTLSNSKSHFPID